MSQEPFSVWILELPPALKETVTEAGGLEIPDTATLSPADRIAVVAALRYLSESSPSLVERAINAKLNLSEEERKELEALNVREPLGHFPINPALRVAAIRCVLEAAISAGGYTSRDRTFVRELAQVLGVAWPVVAELEVQLLAELVAAGQGTSATDFKPSSGTAVRVLIVAGFGLTGMMILLVGGLIVYPILIHSTVAISKGA